MTNAAFGPWTVDLALQIGDPGGFGKVYAATTADGELGVAKYVPKADGSSRELLAQELPASPHLVPILRVEDTSSDHVLIMPRADYSLRQHIGIAGDLELDEVVGIMEQIALGLRVLHTIAIHRDLKPENILYLNGSWALCDFGISRYADAATAADTRKRSFTYQYAAPEQWTYQHASPATDIYALGIIGYELLMGQRPFLGPDSASYALQHTSEKPPQAAGPIGLVSLISACLLKAPQARPDLDDVLTRLAVVRRNQGRPRSSRLAAAQQHSSAETARLSAEEQVLRAEEARRDQLMAVAKDTFEVIESAIASAIKEDAPDTDISVSRFKLHGNLLAGSITIDAPTRWNSLSWGYQSAPAFDVIAFASIQVSQSTAIRGCQSRSHSLYYCDYEVQGKYGWYELAFCPHLQHLPDAPFALSPGDSAVAFSGVFGTVQLAWGGAPLRTEDLEPFVTRWLDYFGAVAENVLTTPSMLPEGRVQPPGPRTK